MPEVVQAPTMRSQQFQEYIKKAKSIQIWSDCFTKKGEETFGTFVVIPKRQAEKIVKARQVNFTINAHFDKEAKVLTIGSPS